MSPNLDKALLTGYRAQATHHLVATAVALYWYKSAHNGAFPAALADLVTQYLPSVPHDPFDENAAPLHYRTGAALYSVGEDGTDNGGAAGGSNRWAGKDAVVSLR